MKLQPGFERQRGAVLLLSLILLTLLSLFLASAFRASAFTASAAQWMHTEHTAFRTAYAALQTALNRPSLPAASDVQLPVDQPSPDMRLALQCNYLGRRNGVTRMSQTGPLLVDLAYVELTADVRAGDGVRHQQQLLVAIVLPPGYTNGAPLPLTRHATALDQPGALLPIAWRNPQGTP